MHLYVLLPALHDVQAVHTTEWMPVDALLCAWRHYRHEGQSQDHGRNPGLHLHWLSGVFFLWRLRRLPALQGNGQHGPVVTWQLSTDFIGSLKSHDRLPPIPLVAKSHMTTFHWFHWLPKTTWPVSAALLGCIFVIWPIAFHWLLFLVEKNWTVLKDCHNIPWMAFISCLFIAYLLSQLLYIVNIQYSNWTMDIFCIM